jgi:hypothetical protein
MDRVAVPQDVTVEKVPHGVRKEQPSAKGPMAAPQTLSTFSLT